MRAILTYHSLDPSGSPISLAPDAFRAHVDWLERGPVRVVDLEGLIDVPDGDDAVAVTFDDGFVNFAEIAVPLLAERGWSSTVFVVPEHVGAHNAWGGVEVPGIPTLPLLDWADLAELAGSGVRVQAHTMHHPHLTRLPDADVVSEIAGSKEQIEDRLGHTVTALAYPYGDVDARVRARAAEHVALAVTTHFDVLARDLDRWALPRLDAFYFRDVSMLRSWGTRRFERYLAWRRGLRAIRRRFARSG